MRPGKYTAAELLQMGWHYTTYKTNGLEMWTKGQEVLYYDRTSQKVVKIEKP